MTRYTMQLRPDVTGNYPEALLREWAQDELGAKRCSDDYLKALRVVLANVARADRHAASLELSATAVCANGEKPFATRQTLRTLLRQLVAAGLVKRREHGRYSTYIYSAKHNPDDSYKAEARLNRILRDAEDEEFRRYCASVGLRPEHVPY